MALFNFTFFDLSIKTAVSFWMVSMSTFKNPCFRTCGQWRVSGRDDGLPADADGGFLSEPGDCAALPQRDRGPLFWSAPQRKNAALPDEGQPRRH